LKRIAVEKLLRFSGPALGETPPGDPIRPSPQAQIHAKALTQQKRNLILSRPSFTSLRMGKNVSPPTGGTVRAHLRDALEERYPAYALSITFGCAPISDISRKSHPNATGSRRFGAAE
jgi:hypothetical protein